jgi:hypothetical protein
MLLLLLLVLLLLLLPLAVVTCKVCALLETKGLSVCSSDSLYAHENDHSVWCTAAIVSSKACPKG